MTTPKTKKSADLPKDGIGALSRRDFIAATAATGIALGVGQPAVASAQAPVAPKPENALPKTEPEMYTGTPLPAPCSRS